MEVFNVATTITLWNGRKTLFWHAPWLAGVKPKDVAPMIFESSKRKNWTVALALHDNAWIKKINLEAPFSPEHLTRFLELWVLINNVQLQEDIEENIVWKFTERFGMSATQGFFAINSPHLF
jgi:hypothetical protein